ncbi:MAG: hypothetical protein WD180_00515, partial [Pseudohongiellaceae bacterium]
MSQQNQDINPEETQEWIDALASVIKNESADRAMYLLGRLAETATRVGQQPAYAAMHTPYRNTIAPQNEDRMPGDMFMERQIR